MAGPRIEYSRARRPMPERLLGSRCRQAAYFAALPNRPITRIYAAHILTGRRVYIFIHI